MLATPYPPLETPAHQPAHLKRLPRIRVAQIAMDYLTHGSPVSIPHSYAGRGETLNHGRCIVYGCPYSPIYYLTAPSFQVRPIPGHNPPQRHKSR